MKANTLAVLSLGTLLLTAPQSFASAEKESKAVEKKEVAVAKDASADAKLQAEAKISMEQARATALKKVPGGTIESGELEREHGKLIYSFDIKTSKPGITEVQVNAITGKIASIKHESPAHEAAEKKQEAKEKTTKH